MCEFYKCNVDQKSKTQKNHSMHYDSAYIQIKIRHRLCLVKEASICCIVLFMQKLETELAYSDRKWISGSLGLGPRGFTAKGHEETSGKTEILYFDWGSGNIGIYTCKSH